MLKSIKIKKLRAITELELDNLGQVNLLVGQNNCGKTTILEALFFLAGAPNPHLLTIANVLRGLSVFNNDLWRTFFHNMETEDSIDIAGKLQDELEVHKLSICVRKEELSATQLTPSDISSASDIGSAKFENGENDYAFAINGLELEYFCSSDPDNKTTSQILVRDGKVVIEGGKHAVNSTDLQEYMINPVGGKNIKECVAKFESYPEIAARVRVTLNNRVVFL